MGLGDMFSKMFKKEEEKDFDESTYKDRNPLTENLKVEESSNQMNESHENKDKKLRGAGEVKLSPITGDTTSSSEQVTKDKILEVLSEVYDPEIPIDIVNLGLIYDVDIEDGNVHVKMTMTAPGCPSSAEITAASKIFIEELSGVKSANIEIVWDPPWDPSRMSEEAKQSMGM